MKKKISLAILSAAIFAGCASNSVNIDKKINEVSIESKIIKKYQISKKSLVKCGDSYYFYTLSSTGVKLTKLDSGYNLVKYVNIPKLIDVTKIKSDNNDIYLLGYDQIKNRPILIKFDKNLNIKEEKYFGNKYDLPKDMTIKNKKPAVVLIHYNNGANIEIYENGKIENFPLTNNQLPKFIMNYDGGMLIAGSIQEPKENLLVVFVKNGKIIWAKSYDFGMSDTPLSVTIKNKNIEITVLSQDYMGARTIYHITLDKNGNIIKKKKDIEIKQLPVRFRT